MGRPQSAAQQARTRLAQATASGDPERIAQARRELAEAKLGSHILALAACAPHLTAEQWAERIRAEAAADRDATPAKRERLALLLPAGGGDDT